MNLDTLPDDELLLVLGFLGARDLLGCRGVCRRLRDMALHPHLWRKRELWVWADGDVQLCAAVLRLVPCLGTLVLRPVYSEYHPQHLRLGPLLVATNCAISNIRVDIGSQSAVFLAMVLSRQAALGRLTSLTLALQTADMTPELRLLLDQVLHTPGLTSLAVTSDSNEAIPSGLSLPKGDVVPASLRRLKMDFKDSTLPLYLKWHADTLEEVELELAEYPDGTAALLASLPRLRELKCSIMDDMPALLQCPALKSLELSVDVDDATRALLPGAHKFLSQAAQRLESLTLEYVEEDELPTKTKVCAGAVNLVLSLAGPGSSAPSALRSLKLTYMEGDAWVHQPQLLPLASVLPRLENLVSLDLGGPHTPHFLEALDGRVLPRLARLRIYIRDNAERGCCPHEWAHSAEPRDLLRRYPQLHLEVEPRHERDGCDDCNSDGCDACKCDFCDKNSCHEFNYTVHTLFTHPGHEVCNQKHGEVGVRIVL